ncbi:hypothetical protein HDU86_004176 [Geranomyces michiganensis]|nr:hypothetical protein HDU86_004176 [Geranomyces michiganensis]
MDHVKHLARSVKEKLNVRNDNHSSSPGSGLATPPDSLAPSETASPSENAETEKERSEKLNSWAASYTDMISKTAEQGPNGPGSVHAPVAHDSVPHKHLVWFYGHRTPQEEPAENYYHFKVFNRETGRIEVERVPLATKLGMEFLFTDLRAVDHTKLIKKTLIRETVRMGKLYNEPASAAHIPGFVNDFNIQLDVLEKPNIQDYRTFNEFFSRKMRPEVRPIASPGDDAIISSAADCRLSVFPTIDLAKKYWIKGHHFTLENLFQSADMAKRFDGGSLGIFRLAPQDYHRWHVPVSGVLSADKKVIPGTFYTVNPKAVKENLDVYTENSREVSMLVSPVFGQVAIVAVGAMLVGSIKQTAKPGVPLTRGEEMGYFEFGGSTVLVLFQPGTMKWDKDLIERSQQGMETLVKLGEKIQPKPFFEQHILEASASSEAVKAGAVGAVVGGTASAAFGWWIGLPKGQLFGEAGRNSAFFAAAAAAFYGTKTVLAQARNKDDMWNGPAGAAVAGVMLGLRSGRVMKVVAHGLLLPTLVAFSEWYAYSMPEGLNRTKTDRHDSGFFQWPRRDPFAERWAELQKKDAEKVSST